MTDDPNDDRRKYQMEIDRIRKAVESGAIPESEGDSIIKFGRHKKSTNTYSGARFQMKYVRRCSEIAKAEDFPPISELDKATFGDFYERLEESDVPDRFLTHTNNGRWSEGTVRNMKNALKQYLLFLDDGRVWVERIEIGGPAKSTVRPEDLLDPSELADMWQEANNARDRALFAIPYCTIQRNSVCRSFRIEDFVVKDGGTQGSIRIFGDAMGRKGAEGTKPVSWAVGPIRDWLEKHPRKDDPSAPILCVHQDTGTADRGDALQSAESINRILRKLARNAGLDKDRWDRSTGRKERTVRAHLLRHTGATRMAKSENYNESQVKKWGGWVQSSSQLDRYINLTDSDVLAAWAEAHNKNPNVWTSDKPEFGKCDRCQSPIEDWLPACPACGHKPGDDTPAVPIKTDKNVEDIVKDAVTQLLENPDPEDYTTGLELSKTIDDMVRDKIEDEIDTAIEERLEDSGLA